MYKIEISYNGEKDRLEPGDGEALDNAGTQQGVVRLSEASPCGANKGENHREKKSHPLAILVSCCRNKQSRGRSRTEAVAGEERDVCKGNIEQDRQIIRQGRQDWPNPKTRLIIAPH